jgi:kojibiose phosphorylase
MMHRYGSDRGNLLYPDPQWSIRVPGFDPASERAIETLLTISNGVAGTCGSLEEGTKASRPATFLAGVFNRRWTKPDPPDHLGESPALEVAPNWLALSLLIDDEPLSIEQGKSLEHERVLDLRQALVLRSWHHRLPSGRVVRLITLRAALLSDRHTFVQRVWITPENFDGRCRLSATLDGHVASGLVFNPQEGIAVCGPGVLLAQTQGLEFTVALAQRCRLADVERVIEACDSHWTPSMLADQWDWQAECGRDYVFDRIVTCFTSRDVPVPAPRASQQHAHILFTGGTEALLNQHRNAWADRWQHASVRIEGDARLERTVRFAAYHLIGTANPDDERTSIGARGLSGTAYLGHVFWDTDIYLLPFFIFTWPAAARTLIMYRYHTLDAARAKAAAFGYEGALYAWESAEGDESTPTKVRGLDDEEVEIFTGRFAHHIAADVAYAIWQYWRATGDDELFAKAGAEMVLETARFWASRVSLEVDGRYHIRRAVGPDEYHELVDDSAFTNTMARFNLELGRQAAAWFERHDPARWHTLASRLKLSRDQLERWADVAARLANAQHRGLIEEFDGYFALEDLDLRAYEHRSASLQVLLGRERVRRTQVVKQADVVLLCQLLWDRFDLETIGRNFEYYEPRCDHGSSLSPSMHALVAARLGRLDGARHHLEKAAAIDLDDQMGDSAQGIHMAAAGGLWQAVILGVAGMRLVNHGLEFQPRLLPGWKALAFTVITRGRRLEVTLRRTPEPCEFVVTEGGGIWIEIAGAGRQYVSGEWRVVI